MANLPCVSGVESSSPEKSREPRRASRSTAAKEVGDAAPEQRQRFPGARYVPSTTAPRLTADIQPDLIEAVERQML
jgi:hypothetical protein